MIALLIKLHRWTESAVFFDGSCVGESPSAKATGRLSVARDEEGDRDSGRSSLEALLTLVQHSTSLRSSSTLQSTSTPCGLSVSDSLVSTRETDQMHSTRINHHDDLLHPATSPTT